jgi:hypothetical protein
VSWEQEIEKTFRRPAAKSEGKEWLEKNMFKWSEDVKMDLTKTWYGDGYWIHLLYDKIVEQNTYVLKFTLQKRCRF